MTDESDKTPGATPTFALLRDVGVLQVKLIVDGLRDLILVPASLIAGLISLVKTHDGVPGPQFYRLLRVGKDSERWINLFGALRNSPEKADAQHFGEGDIDDIVGRFESYIVDEYKRGGVTAQAKTQLDKAIRALKQARSPKA